MHQPNPTDLSLIALEFARTPNNKPAKDFLLDAYELWQSARILIERQRKNEEVAQSKDQATRRPGQDAFFKHYSNKPISFREIIADKMLKKPLGSKGRQGKSPGSVTTEKGMVKSLQRFFAARSPIPPGKDQLKVDLTDDQRRVESEKWLKTILKDKLIPYDLFRSFQSWRSKRQNQSTGKDSEIVGNPQ